MLPVNSTSLSAVLSFKQGSEKMQRVTCLRCHLRLDTKHSPERQSPESQLKQTFTSLYIRPAAAISAPSLIKLGIWVGIRLNVLTSSTPPCRCKPMLCLTSARLEQRQRLIAWQGGKLGLYSLYPFRLLSVASQTYLQLQCLGALRYYRFVLARQ